MILAVGMFATAPVCADRPRSLPDETGIAGCTVHTNRYGTVLYDFTYDKPDKTPIILGAWSKADRVDGGDYCMYADVWYSDGSVKWAVRANFRHGTHDWEKATAVFVPTKPVAKISVRYLCRGTDGTARFRGGYLERRMGNRDVLSVEKRTMRPYVAEDDISGMVLDGNKITPIRFSVSDAGVNSKPSSLAPGKTEIWTTDSMVRVSPYASPSSVKSEKFIELELAKGEAESAQILVSVADDVEWKDGSLFVGKLRNSFGEAHGMKAIGGTPARVLVVVI